MREFTFTSQPSRVVFGAGTLRQVRAEVERLGRARALVIGTPGRAELVGRTLDLLGPLGAARFTGAVPHTPVGVTGQALAVARESGADCLVAVGGGAAIGLAKALAVRTGLPQIVVPTTYAGSEVTAVLGETENGVKTTRSAPEILPGTVIYDVDLTLALPVPLSVASGVNAMAHAVEALYGPRANPATDELALKAIESLAVALPAIAADPGDRQARADALQAAWLAGGSVATAGTGPHHALCHTLGGAFGLPHAETHAAVLPYAMAHAAPAVPDAMRRVARALGTTDAPTAVHDLVSSAYGPLSLRRLGLSGDDLARAVRLAEAITYPSPHETHESRQKTSPAAPAPADSGPDPAPTPGAPAPDGFAAAVLRDAWSGERPPSMTPLADQLRALTGQVTASFADTPDARLRTLMADLVRRLHGFVADHDLTGDEWQAAVGFLTRAGHITSDTRQEFILLSDTLGVSSAVDLLTNSRTASSTPSAVLGPFYVAGPPPREQGADIADGLTGTPLYVSVRITGPDGAPVPGAVADVWQANDDGFYDVQLPELDGPVLRARFHADGDGRIAFRSILPSEYPIPADGPVGEMLRSAGRHPYRAPHLHFMIGAPGRRRLVTQLFVAGGAYLDSDAVFGVKDALVVDFPEHDGPTPDGRPAGGPWRSLDYTFRLAPAQGS